MVIRRPRYSGEEFAQRGNTLYEGKIRRLVEVLTRYPDLD